jgi:tRNA pseudouridine32 synthase/23S rRNA pseudouridine746 synthase
VRKRYQAVVHGHLPQAADWQDIKLPLAADWPRRPMQQVDTERGKPCLTRWRLLGHEGAHSRVQMEPVTGRTHQLRVHFSAIGHAIVGDGLYGEDTGTSWSRLMLHACELELQHPVSGDRLHVREDPPF